MITSLKKINSETFFLSNDIRQQVIQTIERLENAGNHQREIDNCWAEIKKLFKNELKTLPELPKSGFKKNNGKFRKSTTFWNDELSNLWLNLCANEKAYIKSVKIMIFSGAKAPLELANVKNEKNGTENFGIA